MNLGVEWLFVALSMISNNRNENEKRNELAIRSVYII